MTATPIDAFWWSPRRCGRTMLREVRRHGGSWSRLLNPAARAFTNHGDELSALVLREATGRPVRWAPLGREDVVAIGSLLALYLAEGGVGRIWGSGSHTPDLDPGAAAAVSERVLAVRGPRARRALGLSSDVQLGDPGLVVRAFQPRAARRSGTVFIPHFTTYGDAGERRRIAAIRATGALVVPPTLAPEDMLAVIAGADHVVSAGMHGVILAHALRTPATLVSLKDPVPASPAFKYHDYFESVGLAPRLVPWQSVVDPASLRLEREAAAADTAAVDRAVDGLVEGLLAAASPLRSS